MIRTESLALLRAWARNSGSAFAPRMDLIGADDARFHGFAAVRAIRAFPVGEYPGPLCLQPAARLAVIQGETRRAVRAALNAVGLRGAL